MAVHKRKGSPYWQYDFTLTIDGQRHRFRGSTQAVSKGDAQAIEADLRRKALMDPVLGKRKEWTLEQACEAHWIETARFLGSADDIFRAMTNLQRLIGKDRLLSSVDESVIASDLVARRRGEDAQNRGVLVSNRTVNFDLETLRSLMNRAQKVHKVQVPHIDWSELMLAIPDGRTRYLTTEEAERLLNAAAPHLKPIIEVTLWTGLRLQNVLSLDWSSIDMQGRRITRKVKSKTPGGKTHVLPIVDPLFLVLANLGPRDDGPVFTYEQPRLATAVLKEAQETVARHGGNISAAARELGISGNGLRKRLAAQGKVPEPRPITTVRTAWKAALRRAEIDDFRFHDLRHTCASWLVQNGVPLEIVKKILGHSNLRTTERYAHHRTDAVADAMGTLASQLRHTGGGSGHYPIEKKAEK